MKIRQLLFSWLVVVICLSSACGGMQTPATDAGEQVQPAVLEIRTEIPTVLPAELVEEEPAAPTQPTPTAAPQPVNQSGTHGPQLDDFTPGVNPLTGLPVLDPSLLDLPAVLISIPMFPASGRPQAGLSFAPWVFEIYIGEGMTRLLATFYGEEARPGTGLTGSCRIPDEHPGDLGSVMGNRAWLDEDADGTQDAAEPGIAGLCVTLFNLDGVAVASTATDSNGFYGLANLRAGQYRLGFELPSGLEFTQPDIGFEDTDSDIYAGSGQTRGFTFDATNMNLDAGYRRTESAATDNPSATQDASDPPGLPGTPAGSAAAVPSVEVGPIRSMRLPYGTLGRYFAGGCIVSASGDPAVLAQVPGCHYATGDDSDVNSTLLEFTDLKELAGQNKNPVFPVNYSGNLFTTTPPLGGSAASEVKVYWNYGNQSRFVYDPLSGAYQRSTNLPTSVEEFIPQTDRLTGQELLVENVLILFLEHKAHAETLIDIRLDIGEMGRAVLFRDGKKYDIHWSTIAQEYEQTTQRLRPLRFTDASGNPVPLKPGHVWLNVFTTASVVYEKVPGSGTWKAEFHAPLHR